MKFSFFYAKIIVVETKLKISHLKLLEDSL